MAGDAPAAPSPAKAAAPASPAAKEAAAPAPEGGAADPEKDANYVFSNSELERILF